jgi:ATP-dependent helicase/nuclease subunit A
LAELAEFPHAPFRNVEALEEAHHAVLCLANLVFTKERAFRKRIDKNHGFPPDRKQEKARLVDLIAVSMQFPASKISGGRATCLRRATQMRIGSSFAPVSRCCATPPRELKVVFADAAAVDFIEVAQIAESVLKSDDGYPSDAALAVADGIRHLLVDEFQDTSRRQHQLLAGLIAAWPEREGRTLFAVGDPMQSIYFFRDADAELFPRVKQIGLEIPNADAFLPHYVPLSANFRTTPQLVRRLNEAFAKVFASEDGSGVRFAEAMPARDSRSTRNLCFELHLNFAPQAASKKSSTALNSSASETPAAGQLSQIVDLIRSYQPEIEEARAAGKKFRVAVLARTRKSLAQIAAALHEAAIPFRAVDLEKLAARPEVLDALALARALLNPLDRAAWLGVLRAPWCGLSLADLHLLTSADDAALQSRTIPELLAERLPLLSGSGRAAAQRVLSALAGTDTVKEKNPTATLGTWLQQAWTRLGGPDCWNATACANLDLLWRRLDRLSAGEQDLLGPTLDAALDNLTALPDPQAAIDCGVQLMTIHKSKGLEFEVVIVPDLQARDGASSQKLLSWLERGLKPGFDSDELNLEGSEITEFLIAPLPSKGVDKGNAKAWVDAEYKKREVQEARRILYVAATRAREELHLFACPSYKEDANGAMNLANPCGLLSTAWPALEEETRRRFEEWKSTRQADARTEDSASGSSIGEIAASAESNLLFMPSDVRMAARMPARPTLLRRLPIDYRDSASRGLAIAGAEDGSSDCQAHSIAAPLEAAGADRFARHEGGTLSRALGTAVHALLEELAHLRESHEGPNALAALKLRRPRIEARMRASGISGRKAEEIAWEAFQIVVDVLRHAHGEWILSPHLNAANEARWSGVVDGTVRAVQADRVFQAGVAPLSEGDEAWWIIDYKTHAGISNTDAASSLPQLRALFAPQLQAYARVLRNLHGPNAAVRGGLYYPRLLALDWWEL